MDDLDKYIDMLKAQFPDFEYTKNDIITIEDDFTIIVRGVPKERLKEVRSFIKAEIYLAECINNKKTLPTIITLQNFK